jgi:hypothetical protein
MMPLALENLSWRTFKIGCRGAECKVQFLGTGNARARTKLKVYPLTRQLNRIGAKFHGFLADAPPPSPQELKPPSSQLPEVSVCCVGVSVAGGRLTGGGGS